MAHSSDDDMGAVAACTADQEFSDSFTRDFLSCSVCWEPYDDKAHQPKMLACHHTFCKSCLKRLVRGRAIIQCSACRKDTTIFDGVPGLQTNFYIMYMRQKFGIQTSRLNASVCQRHAMQPLSFFCKTCKVLVCRDCIVLAHNKIEGHDLQEVAEIKAEYMATIEQLQKKVDRVIAHRKRTLNGLSMMLGSLDVVHDVAIQQTDALFDQFTELLNQRRQQVKELVREAHESKHRAVNEHLVEVDNQISMLTGIRGEIAKTTASDRFADILELADNADIQEKIGGMDIVAHPAYNYFALDADGLEEKFQAFLYDIGEIKDFNPLPAAVEITAEPAIAGLTSSIAIQVSDNGGQLLRNYPISVRITDPFEDVIPEESEKDSSAEEYRFGYRPQVSGLHKCTVMFLGQPLASACSLVNVQSNNPVEVIGQMGKAAGQLMYPCSLDLDEAGNLYVVDEGNQRIQRFKKDGTIDVIGVSGDTKHARTFDIAMNLHRGEFVCSKVLVEQRKAWADTVQIFSLDGTLKAQFTNPAMKKALYVAVNSKDQIVVPDYHLNSLFLYSYGGDLLGCVGRSGSGPGEFKEPAFVCIGRDDDIIISDCRNSRVQVLDMNGRFKYQIGTKGSGKGQLQGPSGVTTDRHGHIIVTDRVNNRIQVYTYSGEFVSCLDSAGERLSDPRGLAVTDDGFIYVADQKNHCVKKYRYL